VARDQETTSLAPKSVSDAKLLLAAVTVWLEVRWGPPERLNIPGPKAGCRSPQTASPKAIDLFLGLEV
jgi:hypothetical protein